MYKVGSATRCTSPDNCWPYDLMGPYVMIMIMMIMMVMMMIVNDDNSNNHS